MDGLAHPTLNNLLFHVVAFLDTSIVWPIFVVKTPSGSQGGIICQTGKAFNIVIELATAVRAVGGL